MTLLFPQRLSKNKTSLSKVKGILNLKDISKTYITGSIKFEAVKKVSFSIEPGEFVAIAGPSGSGKTTLLNMIGCIEVPSSGSIMLDDVQLASLNDSELAFVRREYLGFIFQNFNLLPVLTALENVSYPLSLKDGNISHAEMLKRSEEALNMVGLDHVKNHKPMELSGGQRQRVAIARALVTRPKIILADEPTANLDQVTGSDVLNLMKKINTDQGTTFIFSTHDNKVMSLADRIIKIEDGKII